MTCWASCCVVIGPGEARSAANTMRETSPLNAACRGGSGLGWRWCCLHGLLTSDINVTTGTISALAGPGDDRRIFQITAPVQPGNSGGPVLDASGHVVGVVVARLDALKMAHLTGRLPQNVNFAISEGAARAFLDAHDVPYKTARSNRTMPTTDIAANAKGYTVLIECWK